PRAQVCDLGGPASPRLRTLPPPGDSQERSDSPEICHYEKSFHKHSAAPNYTHCGLFGDPHLRTFTDRFQTCKVQGAWPLIDNNYLNVQVTNTPVLPGSAATATSKLTIIFKNFQECVDQKVYQAEMDELPAAFADGSKNGGDKHGANSLKITEKVSGQHVEIQAKYIGTTIVVRQVGRYLTFAVRMPEEVVNAVEDRDSQGLYLCLRGCPLNQQIDFQAFRANAEAPAAHPRSPGPVPPLLLSQRTQGPTPGSAPLPRRGRRAVPTAPHCPGPSVSRQPFCCSPGTSHTLAPEAPRLPSERSPLSAQPRAGRWKARPSPPCWFLDGPYVGSKK
uniref:Repulsive guidance molecule BMP co-receptor a n=1 Tax=Ursus maritimus TaxID=29073 RepID=A0A452VNA0_URSMA